MAQSITSNKDVLTFGKYKNKTINQAHINWIFWAIKVGAIIINNKELELELHKRLKSYNDSIKYIDRDTHWANYPVWGDDFF